MIRKPTVLVLGAGASQPYGFPTGPKLRKLILTPHQDVDRFVFSDTSFASEAVERFRQSFNDARVSSVDAFLAHRTGQSLAYGKRFISAHIALCENRNILSPDSGDWMTRLFEIMGRDAKPENIGENTLSIVTFNYDRSFEMAFFLHLRNTYGLSADKVRPIMEQIPVHHIHGSLGPIAGLGYMNEREYAPNLYGLSHDAHLFQLIHEEPGDNDALTQARRKLADAERVIFLGFAFHELNCRRLFHELKRKRGSQWRASCLEMTDAECRVGAKLVPQFSDFYGNDERCTVAFGGSHLDSLMFLRENIDFLVD